MAENNIREVIKKWIAYSRRKGIANPTPEQFKDFMSSLSYDEESIDAAFADNNIFEESTEDEEESENVNSGDSNGEEGQLEDSDKDIRYAEIPKEHRNLYQQITNLISKLTKRQRKLLMMELLRDD